MSMWMDNIKVQSPLDFLKKVHFYQSLFLSSSQNEGIPVAILLLDFL